MILVIFDLNLVLIDCLIKCKGNRMDILKLIMEQMGNQKPLFSDAENKAVAMATLTHNFAVSARKGRTVYPSSVVKDMNAFAGLAQGGLDMGTLLMMAQLQNQASPAKEEEVDVTIADTLAQRLDAIEEKLVTKGKH
tara:strand:+ start:33 stop:443 length:411 start_codon:yes stop_codon:yes gene_type:complete